MDNATPERRDEAPKTGLKQAERLGGQDMLKRRQQAREQLLAAWSFADSMYERLARLCETLTPEMVKGIQEAAFMAEAAGRIELARNLRRCATQLVEALGINLETEGEKIQTYGEMWLG